jgi:hypothetical protein
MNDPYDLCMSPKTKTTRIQTISEEEFHSIKLGHACSEIDEQIETKVEIDHFQNYSNSKKNNNSPSTLRDIEFKRLDEEKIVENLMRLHEQLDKLSQQIEQRPNIESKVVVF